MKSISYINNIKLNKLDFILITLFIFYTARASTISDNDYVLVSIIVFLFLIFKVKSEKLDPFIFLFFLIWSMINLFSYIVNEGQDFSFLTLLGSYMRMLFPYLVIKIIGINFFDKLIKYIYYLAIIILPIYLFDFFMHDFFSSLAPYFNFMTQNEQKIHGGWYIYVYMHSAWAFVVGFPWLYRNCGFMWEGGAYSMILVFSLTYYLSRQKFRFDRVVLVFVFSILTTFSTSGYLALILIWLGYLVQKSKRNTTIVFIFVPLFIVVTYFIINLEFISGKIIEYYYGMFQHYTHRLTGVERINRFGVFYYYLLQTYFWPFGNGVLNSKYLYKQFGVIYEGSNSFATILYQWGIAGVILFILYLKKFYFFLYNEVKISWIMTISLSFVLFSNPETLIKPVIYGIIFYYLIFRKQHNIGIYV